MIDDLVRQVMHVDHRLAHAGPTELVEHMVEQRLAGHRNHRFRHLVRQRTHAQAEPCGEHHGFGRFDGHPSLSQTY
ncbi:hypothetical protein ACVWXM_003660 [Bradyrhizobium sp. GM7.3]